MGLEAWRSVPEMGAPTQTLVHTLTVPSGTGVITWIRTEEKLAMARSSHSPGQQGVTVPLQGDGR